MEILLCAKEDIYDKFIEFLKRNKYQDLAVQIVEKTEVTDEDKRQISKMPQGHLKE